MKGLSLDATFQESLRRVSSAAAMRSPALRVEDDSFDGPPASQKSKVVPQQRTPKAAIPRLQRGLEVAPPAVSPFVLEISSIGLS